MNKCLFIILLLFYFNYGFSVFATVNSKETRFYDNDGKEIGVIVFGRIVNAKKMPSDGKIQIIFDGKEGFVNKKDLVFYNNVFSDIEGKARIISQGKDIMFFYFRNSIYKFNYLDRKVVKKREIKGIFDIVPSSKENIFLIEGITTNDSKEVHNLLIYDFETGSSVYLGSFDNDIVGIENIKFLKDSEYVAILFNRSGKKTIFIYKTINGKLIGYSSDAYGVFDYDNHIFLYNNKYIWFFREGDSNFSNDKLLIDIPDKWLYKNELNYKIEDGNFYVKTKDGVIKYDFTKKESYKMPFKSLEWNSDRNLNFYEIGENEFLIDLEKNKTINISPNYSFYSFVGSNYIVSGKFGKINSYFIFNKDGKEIYRYKAIDKIDFIFENGVVADVIFEDKNCIIFVESPEKGKYYVAFIKE
ncbi:MAG: hypothetical protein N2258_01055 [Brevinematales bacterium]|nr:hypothetical protein [Brevinematales bacterium]